MKTQLNEQQSIIYSKILQHCSMQIMILGGQKKAAKELGIDPSNLCKYLSGVIDPNSKLFFKILDYCHGSVFFGIKSENGLIFPTCQF